MWIVKGLVTRDPKWEGGYEDIYFSKYTTGTAVYMMRPMLDTKGCEQLI